MFINSCHLPLSMVKLKIKGETKEAKFRRIAESRANKILYQLALLRNCANPQVYSYTDVQYKKIFNAIEEELKVTKMAFLSNKNKRRDIKL